MKLLKIRMHQFRRFAKDQSLDLNEGLIALVGANEAGKSTILHALELLGDGRDPSPGDVTRGASGRATLSALYLLETDDLDAIEGIHESYKVRRVWVDLRSDHDNQWRLEDQPLRDLRPRDRCRSLVAAIEEDPTLSPEYSQNAELAWDQQLYLDVLSALSSEDEKLAPSVIQSLEHLASRLRDLKYSRSAEIADGEEVDDDTESARAIDEERQTGRENAASALVDHAEIERRPTPAHQVIDTLSKRLPTVALFQPEDRELQSDYAFSEIVDDPPRALANLCSVARSIWLKSKPNSPPVADRASRSCSRMPMLNYVPAFRVRGPSRASIHAWDRRTMAFCASGSPRRQALTIQSPGSEVMGSAGLSHSTHFLLREVMFDLSCSLMRRRLTCTTTLKQT